MSEFWKRIVTTDRNLVGSTVYFSPNKKWNLKCIVCEDGTVASTSKPNLRFGKISDLIDAWKSGFVTDENGKSLSSWTKTKTLSFSEDFFFETGRRQIVKGIFRKIQNDVGSSQPIKATKQCVGFDIHLHRDALANRKWNADRQLFSPVIIEGDRLRSKKCSGRIDSHQSICRPCKAARQRMWEVRRYLKRETNERSRILHTPNRYLSSTDLSTKQNYRVGDLKWKLRMAKKDSFRARMEMAKYRPIDEENRDAVRSVVKNFNNEQRKVNFPICQWSISGDETCGFRANSIFALISHVCRSLRNLV